MVAVFIAGWIALGAQTPPNPNPVPATYTTAAHVRYLETQFEDARAVSREKDARRVAAPEAGRRLGEILGYNSRLQVRLNAWLQTSAPMQVRGGLTFRLIRAQGLFDAYVASRLLELRGEASAREEALQLERKLGRMIPELRP